MPSLSSFYLGRRSSGATISRRDFCSHRFLQQPPPCLPPWTWMIPRRHTHPPLFPHHPWEAPPRPLLLGTSPAPVFLRPALICLTSAVRRWGMTGPLTHTLRRFLPSSTTGMRNLPPPTFTWALFASADINTPPSIRAHSGPPTSPGGAGPPSNSPDSHRFPSHPTCTKALLSPSHG